jgi:hypothetical protein
MPCELGSSPQGAIAALVAFGLEDRWLVLAGLTSWPKGLSDLPRAEGLCGGRR